LTLFKDQLQQHMSMVLSGIQQTVVDEVIDEQRHLRACVQGMGCHFEHLLQ